MKKFLKCLVLFSIFIPGLARAADCGPSNICEEGMVSITNSTGTTQQTLLTSSSTGNGMVVELVTCSSSVALPASQGVFIDEKNPGGSITQVAVYNSFSSGMGNVSSSQIWNLLQGAAVTGQVVPPITGFPTDTLGNTALFLGPGYTLSIGLQSTLASGTLVCSAIGKQY